MVFVIKRFKQSWIPWMGWFWGGRYAAAGETYYMIAEDDLGSAKWIKVFDKMDDCTLAVNLPNDFLRHAMRWIYSFYRSKS